MEEDDMQYERRCGFFFDNETEFNYSRQMRKLLRILQKKRNEKHR